MLAWLRDLTSRERRTMLACWGGWTLDGFDQQLYSYVVPTVIAVWGMSTGAAGTIGTITVVTSSFGGWFAGALSDRFGRVRMLQIAILWYSVFTFLCSFAQNFGQLFILRGLHGLGFGGEWATGAVLMGEVIRDKTCAGLSCSGSGARHRGVLTRLLPVGCLLSAKFIIMPLTSWDTIC